MNNEKQTPATEMPETGPAPETEVVSAAAAPEATAAAEMNTDEVINKLIQELADARRAADEAHDQLLRAQADLQNFRKRKERETEERVALANARLLLELLPVLDDFERAFAAIPADESNNVWVKGFELIWRKLQAVLEREGVTPIPATGPFDPALHEAVSHEPDTNVPPGEIIAEVRRGYRLGDRVLRPSQVRVAQ